MQDAVKLLDQIRACTEQELMAPELPIVSPMILLTATTLGMAYDDSCVVTGILIGGPAFLSGKISAGDTLLAINGVSLTGIHGKLGEDEIIQLLTGDDIPGSECQVCIERAGFKETVCLKRMKNDLLAHKRQMVSALEKLRLRLKVKYNDGHSLKSLDLVMNLWRATIVAQHEHETKCRSLFAEMQQETSQLLDRLRCLLEGEQSGGEKSAKIQELMDMIEASVTQELIAPHLPVIAPDILPRISGAGTTLGLGLDDSYTVSRILIGGPAFLCGKIAQGDKLMAMNGVPLGGDAQQYAPFGSAPSAGSSASRTSRRNPSGGSVWGTIAGTSAAPIRDAIFELSVGSGSECQVCVCACVSCCVQVFVCMLYCVCSLSLS